MVANGIPMRDGFLRIAITVPYYFSGEAALITAKLQSGEADYVHIRKPESSESELARLLTNIPLKFRARLCLHDCFGIAQKYGIGGLHLNRRNPVAPDNWHCRLSRSCHSINEVADSKGFDYVTLSPIYPSLAKPGYVSVFDFGELKQFLSQSYHVPVIALGGVTAERMLSLQAIGFDGAAMLGDAWRRHFSREQFSLQLITNPQGVEDAERQAREAIAGGCRWVQLRWKEADTNALLEAGKRIVSLCRKAGAIFLLDDHVELVELIDADGVHLGKNDMPVNVARRMLGPARIIGATANTTDDIMHAAQAGADYIGYGPFRFTTTKKNLSPVLGLKGYRKATEFRIKNSLTIPLVAIGGIVESDISDIINAGADGIALSGSIVKSEKPTEATAEILKIIQKNKTDNI